MLPKLKSKPKATNFLKEKKFDEDDYTNANKIPAFKANPFKLTQVKSL